MSPVTKRQVEEGRAENVRARQGADPAQFPAAQKAKRSTRSNRLAGGRTFTGVTLTIPFKYCVSDNDRVMIQHRQRRIVLRPEYRAAKDTIQHIARKAMNGAAPTEEAVE